MHPLAQHPVVAKLSELFQNADFATQLASALDSFSTQDKGVCLRIDVVVCSSDPAKSTFTGSNDKSLSLVRSTIHNHVGISIEMTRT